MIRDFFDWLRTVSPEKRKKALALLGVGSIITLGAMVSILIVIKAQSAPESLVIETENQDPQNEAAHKNEPPHWSYEMNHVSMAIMNKKGTKTAYAQFSLVLDCPSEEAKQRLSMNRAKLLDAVFSVGGNFYLDDFQGAAAPTSFEKFKKELLKQYQKDFGASAPVQIAIKDWLIQ